MKVYIYDKLGSKRGAARYGWYKLLLYLGVYRKYQAIDLDKIQRFVFVCSGNICRSSYGEYVAKSLGVEAISYGLHCTDGHVADKRAIAYAVTQGLDMALHRTQNIGHFEYQSGDLVVAMEPAHLRSLRKVLPKDALVTSIALWGDPTSIYLHDPYSCNAEYFNWCEHRVHVAVENMVNLKTAVER